MAASNEKDRNDDKLHHAAQVHEDQWLAERDRNIFTIRSHIYVTTGDVAERITAVQVALDVDLIVMGTHGRRAVPRLFLGSVADRVIREAKCPVLTVRRAESRTISDQGGLRCHIRLQES